MFGRGKLFLAGRYQQLDQLGNRQPFHPGLAKQHTIRLPDQGPSAWAILFPPDSNPVAVKFQVAVEIRVILHGHPGGRGLQSPLVPCRSKPTGINRSLGRHQLRIEKLAGTIQDSATRDLQLPRPLEHAAGRKPTQAGQVDLLEIPHQFNSARLPATDTGQLAIKQALAAKPRKWGKLAGEHPYR